MVKKNPQDKYMQWLRLPRLAQTGVDVPTEVEVKLPTIPEDGLVMVIHEIDFMPIMPPAIDGSWAQMTLATQSGIPYGSLRYDNEAVIDLHESRCSGSAGGILPTICHRHVYPKPFIIAHPNLFMYVTSALTTLVNIINGRIGFTFEKVSTEEFFQALASYR
ncbi:hypothetical protein ES703_113295 [subsurface metagenome]